MRYGIAIMAVALCVGIGFAQPAPEAPKDAVQEDQAPAAPRRPAHKPLTAPWDSPRLSLAETIDLRSPEPGPAELARTVLGGQFTDRGWQVSDKMDRLAIELREGFPADASGAIELDMTNLDFDAQVNGTKQHFFNLYAEASGDQFTTQRNAFFSLRGGNYKKDGLRGIKVLWRGVSPVRHEAATFGARKWDPSAVYTWRVEWNRDELVVLLNGERIFGPAVFDNRAADMPLKHVFLSRDGIKNEKVWFGFPGPAYQTMRIYRQPR